MTDMQDQPDMHFYQLIISLHTSTMQQLGKVTSPMTGKIERNIDMAKNSIDMLEMLDRKMKGNLSDDERKLIETTLFELRMNYMDELKKEKERPEKKSAESDSTEEPTKESATSSTADAPSDEEPNSTG